MSSKKQRNEKKLSRPKASAPAAVNKAPAAIGKTNRPIYTALFMIAGIFILSFIFRIMLNTVISDIYINDHPELANDNDALVKAISEYLNDSLIYAIAQRLIINVSGILGMMMLFHTLEKDTIPVIGFINNGKRRIDIGMGVLFSFVAVLLAYNILTLIGYVKVTGTFVFSWIQLLWTADITIMCIFEEMLFRGYFIYKLQNIKPIYTIAITSVLFALYKGLPSTMPSTYVTYIVMGAFLAYTSIKLKTIWFSLSFRFIWTFTSAILLSIYAEVIPGIIENEGIAESLLSGNKAGFENGLIAAVIIGICFIIAKRMIESRANPKPQRKLYKDGTIR